MERGARRSNSQSELDLGGKSSLEIKILGKSRVREITSRLNTAFLWRVRRAVWKRLTLKRESLTGQ